MFRQVKSALFWYYLYKFRRKVVFITFLLVTAIFANAIYADIVEYLTLKEKLEYLELALFSKWAIIIFNLTLSIYFILTLFKNQKDEQSDKKDSSKTKNNDIIYENKEKKSSSKFSKREEEFLKKDLKSKADLLVER